MYEAAVFTSFIGISILAHQVAEHYERRKRDEGKQSPFNHHHASIVTALSPAAVHGLLHPAVWHGVRDYVVHFIIYSGQIIPPH